MNVSPLEENSVTKRTRFIHEGGDDDFRSSKKDDAVSILDTEAA